MLGLRMLDSDDDDIVIADVSYYIVWTLVGRRVLCRSCLSPISVLPDGLSVGNCRYGRIVTNQRSSREALTLGEVRVAPLSESVAVELSSQSNTNITNSSSAF